jgi:hypothetical protein
MTGDEQATIDTSEETDATHDMPKHQEQSG